MTINNSVSHRINILHCKFHLAKTQHNTQSSKVLKTLELLRANDYPIFYLRFWRFITKFGIKDLTGLFL